MNILKEAVIYNSELCNNAMLITALIGIVLIITAIAAYNDTTRSRVTASVIGVILIGIAILCGVKSVNTDTGKRRYTVQLTEKDKYVELIQKGYKFESKPYDDIEIYEIVGDPLSEE